MGRSVVGTYHTATKVTTTRATRAARLTTTPATANLTARNAKAKATATKDTVNKGTASKGTASKDTTVKIKGISVATMLAQIATKVITGVTRMRTTSMGAQISRGHRNPTRGIRDKGIKVVVGVKLYDMDRHKN